MYSGIAFVVAGRFTKILLLLLSLPVVDGVLLVRHLEPVEAVSGKHPRVPAATPNEVVAISVGIEEPPNVHEFQCPHPAATKATKHDPQRPQQVGVGADLGL